MSLTLVLAACGDDDDSDTNSGDDDSSETSDSPSGDDGDGVDDGDAASDGTVTIVDAQDRSVEVPLNPETVVVLDWSVARTLTDLGIEVDALPEAVGDLPADLAPVADAAETVGTLFEPDYEGIAAMEPDLVIVGSRSGTPEVVAEIERFTDAVIDMSVRYEDADDQFPQFRERVEGLASIFEVSDGAAARLDAIEASVAETKADAEASELQALFVQVSGGTVNAYGPGSRFGIIYDNLGLAPTDAPVDNEGSHGQEISQEFFVQYNPGVVYVLDRSKAIGEDATPALDVLNNGLVDTTDAATNDRIIEVDGFSWYLATYALSSYEQIIEDVRAGL